MDTWPSLAFAGPSYTLTEGGRNARSTREKPGAAVCSGICPGGGQCDNRTFARCGAMASQSYDLFGADEPVRHMTPLPRKAPILPLNPLNQVDCFLHSDEPNRRSLRPCPANQSLQSRRLNWTDGLYLREYVVLHSTDTVRREACRHRGCFQIQTFCNRKG